MRPSTWQHVLFTALCFATAAVQVALADDGSTNGALHACGTALATYVLNDAPVCRQALYHHRTHGG